MRYLLIVVALVIGACRVDGTDGDADAWVDSDADVEVDADGQVGCPSACAEVDCSGVGICDMDLFDCTPYCLCMEGYHQSGDGLECLPD